MMIELAKSYGLDKIKVKHTIYTRVENESLQYKSLELFMLSKATWNVMMKELEIIIENMKTNRWNKDWLSRYQMDLRNKENRTEYSEDGKWVRCQEPDI
jgi:hypothetical protein